ncbi:acyl-CoA dehydrogenase family protein [Microbacterium sp. NPDC055357]
MRLELNADEREFRDRARTWLLENIPEDPRPIEPIAAAEYDRSWQRRQFDGGWAGVTWPTEFGGAGLSLTEQILWVEQCARLDAPEAGLFNIAMGHAGPVIMTQGDDAQRAQHLAPILRGECAWAQGFSEPESGSDLASIRTRAVVDGNDLVVTGSKIWTTRGDVSDWQELLVRTDPASERHRGLSFLLVDLRSPGIEIAPIVGMDGSAPFSQVFYDEVRVPKSGLVGELGDGWRVAMATLGFERGSMTFGYAVRLIRLLDRVAQIARDRVDRRGRPVLADDRVAADLADLESECIALHAFALTVVSQTVKTGTTGPQGAMLRPLYAETAQRVKRFAFEILGRDGLVLDLDREIVTDYLYSAAHTIGTGTSEVQRNVIAERVLGLPRA